MYMASQKQIDFVERIENVLDIKYYGTYDFGTIDEFIRNNISEYKTACLFANPDYELYELIDERF